MTEETKKKPYRQPECEEWKGSPLPWRTYRYDAAFCDVEHAEGKSILVGAMFFKDDAALIVQAVNGRKRLLKLVSRLLNAVDALLEAVDEGDYDDLRADAREALKEAGYGE